MPINQRQLLDNFGTVVNAGNAGLFIGAGLSLSAGYPSWSSLVEGLRSEAKIPSEVDDLPLVSEYYVQTVPGGRPALEDRLLRQLQAVPTQYSTAHDNIAKLPINEIWTTNYDRLIETSLSDADVISSEADLLPRRLVKSRRVVKMHGSLAVHPPGGWASSPVITRGDFERYSQERPRLWAALRAIYLTQTLLFLGFSFTDPNMDVLLRLSRSLKSSGAPEHFTVLKLPADPVKRRLHDLQVVDLEDSGIRVCEVDDFTELGPLLTALVRRTRSRAVFISGSVPRGSSSIHALCESVGSRLAAAPVTLMSNGGPAGMQMSFSFANMLIAEGKYESNRVQFYFRPPHDKPAPSLPRRIGSAIYTPWDIDELRKNVIDECRAILIIGGKEGTRKEVEIAQQLGLPVIPLAAAGGVAKEVWSSMNSSGQQLYDETDVKHWEALASEDVHVAGAAAAALVRHSMYLS